MKDKKKGSVSLAARVYKILGKILNKIFKRPLGIDEEIYNGIFERDSKAGYKLDFEFRNHTLNP